MGEPLLPSSKQLRTRFAVFGVSAAAATSGILTLYVLLLTDIEAADWWTFGGSLVLVGLLAGGACVHWFRLGLRPIIRWLDLQRTVEQESEEEHPAETLRRLE